MNEPHRGYIELHSPTSWDYNTDREPSAVFFPALPLSDPALCSAKVFIDKVPNFLQSLALGSGHPQLIDVYKPSWPFPSTLSHRTVVSPPPGVRAWKPGVECIWKEHGVWEWDEKSSKAVILKAGYFSKDPRTRKRFEFYHDAYFPFARRFAKRVQRQREDWLIPVGPIPNEVRAARQNPSLSARTDPRAPVAVLPVLACESAATQPRLGSALYVPISCSCRAFVGALICPRRKSTTCTVSSPNRTET